MAFTKIAAAGIGSTETVTLHSLEVLNNATVGGVLTYEDVTNVDSIGIITARAGVLVGSGITLSSDGDVFFTGIATGNGSGLTAINASNIGSGTVPTARLGSGTASSSTFLRGDSTFQTVNTDLVADTTPQLGGNLDVNTKNILFGDSSDGSSDDVLKFGASSDLKIYHDGSHSRIDEVGTGNLMIQSDNAVFIKKGTSENIAIFNADGAVELYHNNIKTLDTTTTGIRVHGDEGGTAQLQLLADQGDDNGDYWRFVAETDGILNIQDYGSGSWYNNLRLNGNTGGAELYHNNEQKLYTATNGTVIKSEGDTTLGVYGGSGGSGYAQLYLNGSGTSSNYVQSDNGLIMWINGANRAKFETDGTFIVQDGNVKINTAGHGIDFSATSDGYGTDSSELLDDYEEGTFTPTATNFTIATTYSANYTKIGNVVHIQMYLSAGTGSGTGAVSIGGLPYTAKGSNYYSYACGRIGGGTNAQNDIVFQFNQNNVTAIPFISDGNINEQMISGQHLIMSGFYQT